jgi:hypothetical protein
MELIDSLFKRLRERFDEVTDHRNSINTQFDLGDTLMCGFALFSQKDSSLLQFINNFKERGSNLRKIYGVKKCPSDGGLRQILDEVEPEILSPIIGEQVQWLYEQDGLSDYELLDGHLLIPIDGTTHHSSHDVNCSKCLIKKHRNGDVTYSHSMLCATIVHPNASEVFPCAIEAIVNEDGCKKNDCELTAVRRLLPQIRTALPTAKIILGGDSIFANAPYIRALRSEDLNFRFLFTIKEGYQGYPLIQFQQLSKLNKTRKSFVKDKTHEYQYEYANGLILNGQAQDISVNFLQLSLKDIKTGQITVFQWITDIEITMINVVMVAKAGRARWKIENETFNTLKNQGYQFEHNFGHGKKNLATIFAILMFLAFLLDQIQQRFDKSFKKALLVAKSKINLWQKIRQIFNLIEVDSMDTIYKIINKEVKLSINIIT